MKDQTRGGPILESRIKLDPPADGLNLASVLKDGIEQNSTKTLIVDAKRGTKWTGAELLDKVERIATGLIQVAGLESGQVVLSICDHTDNEMLMALGVIFAGGAIYGTSPDDGYEEEKNYCQMVPPSVIVCNSNLHQMVAKLKQNVQGMENVRIIWIDNPESDCNGTLDSNNNHSSDPYWAKIRHEDQIILFDDLLDGPRDQSLINEVIGNRIEPTTQNVTFLLTSGSTGKPKVVPNTHEELVWALYSMKSCWKYPIGSNDNVRNPNKPTSEEEKFILPYDGNSVLSGDLPLDHGAGLNTMFAALLAGSKLIILPSYEEDSFWQGVHDHRITVSIASTTFAYKLLARLKQLISLGEHKRWDLSSFKFLACCGSKLAFQDLVREINEVYPHLRITQAYGCTEIGYISMLPAQDSRDYLDSVGYMFPGLRAKVVCLETGKLLGPNERGQLHLSSMTEFKAYKCMPGDKPAELYAECHDEENFYKTGDYVHYDEEQRLYIHGRLKDTLFLMQDWKILPIELEEVVNKHPLVEYSAVVGIPDPDLPGCDAPKAFVKLISIESTEFQELESDELRTKLLADDRDFIVRDIYKFVADRTAAPKHLKGGVRILEEFPRNGLLCKIDRKILKQMD